MKKIFENKFNLLPLCSMVLGLIGLLISVFGLGIPGIVVAAVGLVGSIVSKCLSKKLEIDDVLSYIGVLVSILLLIGAGIAFGVGMVLDIMSAKDIG